MGRFGWTCVAALLLAGCADPVASIDDEPDEPEPVVAKRGAIYVDFRSPKNIEDEFRWSLSAVAPDGTVLEGQQYFEHPEGTACWFWDLHLDDDVGIEEPCCDNPAQVDGDLQCADSTNVGPYVHFLFEDVEYNGTWTVDVALEYAHVVGGAETGHPDLQVDMCTHVRLTEPDTSFRGGGALPESECIIGGTVTFDYATQAWNYTLADVDWCPGCSSP